MDSQGHEPPNTQGQPAQADGNLAPISSLPPLLDESTARSRYDAKLADKAVRLPQVLFDVRFWQLGVALLTFTITCFKQMAWLDHNRTAEERLSARAIAFRQLLFDLGPTFIKLGQYLSARGDLMPEQFAKELSLLQDRVPPFSLLQVKETVRLDLGFDPKEIFAQFDETPLASASIGQVHRVHLKEGGYAVVKVQRPGLSRSFYRDLGLMRLLAKLWVSCFTLYDEISGSSGNKDESTSQPKEAVTAAAGWQTKPAKGTSTLKHKHRRLDVKAWIELADEFGHTLFTEIDYLQEGRNADRLRRAVRSKPHILIPRVHWRYTGRHVLTLEYIPGIKISEVKELEQRGFDLEQVGNMLINCYLEQFVLTGFFHADPHAGNLAVDDYGRLIIYDFGMMGEISEAHRRALLQCVMAVVRRDCDRVTQSLTELGIVSADASMEAVSRSIAPFIEYYAGRDITKLDFENLEGDVDQVIKERSFRLPANLAYLLRAGSSLEGIARTLKPDFSFVEAVRPLMVKWALQQGIESLARSGKLLEFAEFAFAELKASWSKGQHKTAHDEALDNIETALALKGKSKDQAQKQKPAEAPEAKPQSLAAEAKTCLDCQLKANQLASLQPRMRVLRLLTASLLLLSTTTIVWLANGASSSYGQVFLYFLIGFTVLGAIIFWKFT